MTKQQKNRAFVKMLKEFPKAFGRVSFRERLMLRTAFTYVVEEVIDDLFEGKDLVIKELGERCNQLLKDKGNLTDELDERTKDLLNANHRIEQMQDAKCTSCTELGGMQLKINRLEQQIEKMKCCGNCSHRRYWGNELGCKLDLDKQFECDNNNKKYWEFREE